ncbi:jg701 [Pararge aegeria aegeria]|uniref:Jg701 protein n=1 Tax=Pararge aegeria aegeria TaxID=348720 RepID=A0A8S4R849_9NEOP|nr:jg701 [Pararge aegeria aegeria]
MPCSAVTLSIATITAIVAAALMAIAFSTDNWLYVEVKRNSIQTYVTENTDINSQAILESLNTKYYFYTRTRGLFRICYPKERPPTVKHPVTEKHSCSSHKHFPVVEIEPTALDSESRVAAHCASQPSIIY